MKYYSFRELLSRSFATVDVEPTTGKRKDTIVNGHVVVTGTHYLAFYEIDALVEALRKSVANEEQELK